MDIKNTSENNLEELLIVETTVAEESVNMTMEIDAEHSDSEAFEVNDAPSDGVTVEAADNSEKPHVEKRSVLKFPLARVKRIVKSDPEITKVNEEAMFYITKATEMFMEILAKEAGRFVQLRKRKTLLNADLHAAINSVPRFCFLEGALE